MSTGIFAKPWREQLGALRPKHWLTKLIYTSVPLSRESRLILMPGKEGPELRLSEEKGVPRSSIYVVERNEEVWKTLRQKGYSTTKKPMDFINAVPYYGDLELPFHLMHFDFQSILTPAYVDTFKYILARRMLAQGAWLLVTTGWGRSSEEGHALNKEVAQEADWRREYPPTLEILRRRVFFEASLFPFTTDLTYQNHRGQTFVVTVAIF